MSFHATTSGIIGATTIGYAADGGCKGGF